MHDELDLQEPSVAQIRRSGADVKHFRRVDGKPTSILAGVSLEDRIREMFGAMSKTELATKLGVNRATLYAAFKREIETGRHNIDSDTAIALRKLSGRSLSWILTGEEDAPRVPDVELRAARRVAHVISKDLDLPLPIARELVGRVALDEATQWSDDLELYRLVRAAAGVPSVKHHSSAPKPKLLGVGEKVSARDKR